MKPPNPDKLAQVRELIAADKMEAAKAALQRILKQSPRDAGANNLLSAILAREGQNESAMFYAKRALDIVPDNPALLQTYGNLQALTGDHAAGEKTLRRAVAQSPGDPDLRLSLTKIMMIAGELAAGVRECELAERQGVTAPMLAQHHAGLLSALGRVDDAIRVLREATVRWPEHTLPPSQMACLTNYSTAVSATEVLEVHKRYGALLTAQLPPLPPPPVPRDPEKKLRVGIVSSDLRQHSVSYFLEPLLERLDRSQFEIVCYHVCLKEDAVSRRLRGLVRTWRHEPNTAPTPLATMIRADAVDILIELNGHTDGQRLAAIHLRPAPLQMTWLGYPNTTGVGAVDARIVDSITDPPGAEALATERLIRLDPCFLCYRPPTPALAVALRPEHGPIVFGCFGTMQKISDRCIALWAGALAAVPASRLYLKNRAMSEPEAKGALLSRLSAAGIGPERVDLRTWNESTGDHLSAYGEVDIALDSTPYNGTTTTCEALYMGVPVVALAGEVHASRVGASLLNAVGLGAMVARDPAHFAAIAGAVAADRTALAVVRAGLRERLLGSTLCNEQAFAARFGAMLREAWRDRCRAG